MDPPVKLSVILLLRGHFIFKVSVECFHFFLQKFLDQKRSLPFLKLVGQVEEISWPHQPTSLRAKSTNCFQGLLISKDCAVVAEPIFLRNFRVYCRPITLLMCTKLARVTKHNQIVVFVVIRIANHTSMSLLLENCFRGLRASLQASRVRKALSSLLFTSLRPTRLLRNECR